MTEPPLTGDWARPAREEPDVQMELAWPTSPGYEIQSELGRGGMGVVYRALQQSSQRLVALKLIRDGALAGTRELDRFRIEAEATSRMRHPNIVEIFECSEHQGRPYFAMELVEGGSLDRYLAGNPQPARQAAQLVRALALAVDHAHARKIIHRDLKPANILLARESADGGTDNGTREILPLAAHQPKITDFGLAKRLDDSHILTRDGAVLGTVGYMAPEQASGRKGQIGPAVDIYSLGAILYELLTGRKPFEGDSWQETVEHVLHDEPAPPTQLQLSVPPELETICLTCLDKEPGRRYASALELADDLGRFLAGTSVLAVPMSERERHVRLAARDGYEVLEEIGRGPRSTVYRALYGQLSQPVALKVFHADANGRDAWEARMRSGAQLWSTLAHPHLVPVQRAGWWQGYPYLAYEYVPQGSLATRFAAQRYTVGEALNLTEQLAQTVMYLHRQGVVHGNLKPSNVLLAADGIPRVTDLRTSGGLFQYPLPADDGDPAGLGYLAPELIDDLHCELRPFTDIYGLGMILYEMLAGRAPFAGSTASTALEQVRAQQPAALCGPVPTVSPELEAFCLRCLHKNPWRRYARVYGMLSGMRWMLSKIPPHDRPPR